MGAPPGRSRARWMALAGYVALGVILSTGIGSAILFGSGTAPAPNLAGRYRLDMTDPCIGPAGSSIALTQSGAFLRLSAADAPAGSADASISGGGSNDRQRLAADLRLTDGALGGTATCVDGSTIQLQLRVEAAAGTSQRALTDVTSSVRATFQPDPVDAKKAADGLSPEQTFARLMLAIAAVILVARIFGTLLGRLGQPRVMGEVLAGILLGPTLLGQLSPGVSAYLFPPSQIVPLLGAAANIGLAFYMFLVGLELDPSALSGRARQAAFISNASIAAPLALGFMAAVALHPILGPAGVPFLPFALFIGVSMSITAFPVLARILVERRMLHQPVGALALAAAAVDDVTAWGLLALATAVAKATGPAECIGAASCAAPDPVVALVRVAGLAIVFCLIMAFGVRRLLRRVSTVYDEAGHVPVGWISLIFLGVLLASATAGLIGIAPIFGAFVMGLVMPRREGLSRDVARRLEDFVVIVLLPLFFVVAGLKTNVGLLQDPSLILMTGGLIAIAIVAKLGSATLAARWTGMTGRESLAVGVLMNTRGLTELIVLNLGLELKVITPVLFTMLVIMALTTTFMTGPLLRLVDRRGAFAEAPEDRLGALPATSPATPARREILVVALDERNLDGLLAVATSLSRAEPAREVVAVRLLEPGPITAGTATLDRQLGAAQAVLDEHRRRLLDQGVSIRVAAFTSAHPGRDLIGLAGTAEIDLILVDGHRPVVGGGVLAGPVGDLLAHSQADVAVLVRNRDRRPIAIASGSPVVVPFGGAEHDWAALELGAWIAGTTGASLRLVGVGPAGGSDGDPSRLLANASIVVQQLVGVEATARIVDPSPSGIAEAAADAALLVVGLSDRWRQEGLGPMRTELARTASAPVLFVRRGSRPGALAPRGDLTRFAWSISGSPIPPAPEVAPPHNDP